jgi:hypothetical protein
VIKFRLCITYSRNLHDIYTYDKKNAYVLGHTVNVKTVKYITDPSKNCGLFVSPLSTEMHFKLFVIVQTVLSQLWA